MKTILNKTLALTLLILSAASSANAEDLVQYIDCRYMGSTADDHVIVSLTSPTTGTFFYTTGLDSEGNDHRTSKLTLNHTRDSADHSFFAASTIVDDYGTPVSVSFFFAMPKEMIFKASSYFIASLTADTTDSSTTRNTSTDLECFSALYPKQ